MFSCKEKSFRSTEKQRIDSDSINYYISSIGNSDKSRKAKAIARVVKFISTTDNSNLNRDRLYSATKAFLESNDKENFRKGILKLEEYSFDASDSLMIGKSLNLRSNEHFGYRNDSAYYFLIKAEKVLLKIGDSTFIGTNYLDKAFVQLYESEYSASEISAIQALGYFRDSNNIKSKYSIYNVIGICSNELRNYENAIIYHTKALEVARQNELPRDLHLEANSRNNIGVVYQNLKDYEKSIAIFEVALSEANLLKDNPSLYSMITDNLAYSKLKSNKLDGVERLLQRALKIREENALDAGVIINKIHLSEYFQAIKDTPNAIEYARQALALSKEKSISGDLLTSLKQLSIIDTENSPNYSKEYIEISDSIQQAERIEKDKFARIAYETEEISLQKEKLAEQNRNLLYFFVGSLMIGLLLFVIRTQRARNRELMLKQAQQKANVDIYNLMISQQNMIEESRIKEKKRIAQELHDGVLGRLFGTRLNLDSLNRMTDEESLKKRNDYLSELKNIEQDIREISHDLNREKYALINNFLAILNNLLEEQRASFDSQVESLIDNRINWDEHNNTLKINVYRIIQECLQNINKYAKATKVKIEIKEEQNAILVVVADNGVGFDAELRKKGIGLQNMNSRTEELGGKIEIKSKKGKGTSITATFPVKM